MALKPLVIFPNTTYRLPVRSHMACRMGGRCTVPMRTPVRPVTTSTAISISHAVAATAPCRNKRSHNLTYGARYPFVLPVISRGGRFDKYSYVTYKVLVNRPLRDGGGFRSSKGVEGTIT